MSIFSLKNCYFELERICHFLWHFSAENNGIYLYKINKQNTIDTQSWTNSCLFLNCLILRINLHFHLNCGTQYVVNNSLEWNLNQFQNIIRSAAFFALPIYYKNWSKVVVFSYVQSVLKNKQNIFCSFF